MKASDQAELVVIQTFLASERYFTSGSEARQEAHTIHRNPCSLLVRW